MRFDIQVREAGDSATSGLRFLLTLSVLYLFKGTRHWKDTACIGIFFVANCFYTLILMCDDVPV